MAELILHGYHDPRWPESLPGDWVFPVPPVAHYLWTERDWVRWAAPYNKSKWEGNDAADN